MTVLVLCGRGRTGSRLCSLLDNANIPFLAAVRAPSTSSSYRQCSFDWTDSSTYENPFSASSAPGVGAISAVYLVQPPVMGAMGERGIRFVDVARSQGVRRFVLLSASIIEQGGEAMGKTHEYLASLRGIEYSVLRPTWFMQNFSGGEHLGSIRDENTIFSAAGYGKIPFVSAEDIAHVAFHVLTNKLLHGPELFITGPQLLSYDQIADTLTRVLGRKISHVGLNEAALARRLSDKYGYPAELAAMVAQMDTAVKNGSEERLEDSNTVEDITGSFPERFHDFAAREKQCWL